MDTSPAGVRGCPVIFPQERHARMPANRKNVPDVTLVNLNLMLVERVTFLDAENYIPLGLLYIAAVLQRDGADVEFVDYQLCPDARRFDPARFADALGHTAPIVGLSCMSNLLPFTILVAERIKRINPDSTVVLGGVGPSPVATAIRREFPFVDIVVEGEGELCMLDILRGGREPLPARQIVRDLDSLPFPAYSLLDLGAYLPARSLITSRGCPRHCTFCTEPHNFGGAVRFRSIESIVQEIELLHSLHDHTTFLFQDDQLTLDRKRCADLLKTLRDLSFPIQWKCFSRVDLADDDLLAEMAASGCVQVRYGVESGSNETLKRIGKGFTIEQAYEAAVRSLRHVPSVHASFIWGYPFEDVDGFHETLTWAERFEAAGVSVLLFEFSPLPGSELYRQYRDGLVFSREAYSSFVITGHEQVQRDGSYASPHKSDPMLGLVAAHPEIFPGFYHYKQRDVLRASLHVAHLKYSGRTPARSPYDR